tara:strand:+ start:311 stop:673 length:363 start_codon:yes stop_codon:yes gene_type:complete
VDGAIDIKTVMTIAAMIASVAGAAAVARLQIKELAEKLSDVEGRLREMDSRADRLWTMTETQETRLNVLAKMASPENLRRDHIQLATLISDVRQLRKDVDHQLHIHNSKHIPVSDTHKAE